MNNRIEELKEFQGLADAAEMDVFNKIVICEANTIPTRQPR